MTIEEYFDNSDSKNSNTKLKLQNGPFYAKTIENFYDQCIKNSINSIILNIKNWDTLINDYIDSDCPVYWIRKYESVGDRVDNKQNNRRSCLTIVVDDNKVKFAYAFISNYDAQELYNMIRIDVDAPEEDFLLNMLKKGKYQFHYQKEGKDCQDNKITYFENRGTVQSGIINQQNWYLAHIIDVNGIEYKNEYNLSNSEIDNIFFSRGDIKDWKSIPSNDYDNFVFNRDKTNSGLERKVWLPSLSFFIFLAAFECTVR